MIRGCDSITRKILKTDISVNSLHRGHRCDAGNRLIHHVALWGGGAKVATVVKPVGGPHAVITLLPCHLWAFKCARVATKY